MPYLITAEFQKRRSQSIATRRRISAALKGRRRKPLRDPQGGLTAEGRKWYRKKFGNRLRPGVRKPASRMSLQEMRRKGSWAKRFYGRQNLPPLVKPNGQPTRLALTARAWGEPVPRSPAAARRIAAKGDSLLRRYHRLKKQRRKR
ncbi:MAG TPA: DUF6321 domain-containing protein [Allocoleopsis sp.]